MTQRTFNRTLSRLLWGSSAVWAMVLFLPWYSGSSPWERDPDDRIVRGVFLLLSVLAGWAVAKFPWWNEAVEDASRLDKLVFLLIVVGSCLWLLCLTIMAFLALVVFLQ
jgi:hypothetical protein